jgi:transposase
VCLSHDSHVGGSGDNNLSERTLRAIALGRNNWGVIGSEAGGKTAAVLYTMVGTCKHLGVDPFVYLQEALPGLFALGEEPTKEQILPWLPDRWLLCRARESPVKQAAAGQANVKLLGQPVSLLGAAERADSL